jgi:hypothetical protein
MFEPPFRVRRNPDGSLPHVGLGSGPPRSMYPDGNTIDFVEQLRRVMEAQLNGRPSVPPSMKIDESVKIMAVAGPPLTRYLYGTRDRGQLVETEIVR